MLIVPHPRLLIVAVTDFFLESHITVILYPYFNKASMNCY